MAFTDAPVLADLAGAVEQLAEVTDRVPLGFADFPAAASLVRRAADTVSELVWRVPDDICGDIDLLEIVTDLQLIAGRLQGRANGARQ
jgi:hypothetical protein